MSRRRKQVMGLPIGRSRRSFPLRRAVSVGAAGAAALAAVPAAQKGMQAVQKGRDLKGQADSALHTVGEVKDAVSSHSSTIGKAAGLIGALSRAGKKDDGKPKLAHLIEEHTDISVPRSVAYNQWTQLEMLPRITKGVASVEQKNDSELQWASKIGPVQRQWKAKITEQVPDERIAWKSEGGPEHQGVVTFHSLDEDLTRVLVQMHYHPHGPFEVVANKLRIQRRRVRRDLRLFKHFLELRGEATGEWRGKIDDDSSEKGDPEPSDDQSSDDAQVSPPSEGRARRTTAAGRSKASGRRTAPANGSRPTTTSGSTRSSGRSRSNGNSRSASSNGSRSSSTRTAASRTAANSRSASTNGSRSSGTRAAKASGTRSRAATR